MTIPFNSTPCASKFRGANGSQPSYSDSITTFSSCLSPARLVLLPCHPPPFFLHHQKSIHHHYPPCSVAAIDEKARRAYITGAPMQPGVRRRSCFLLLPFLLPSLSFDRQTPLYPPPFFSSCFPLHHNYSLSLCPGLLTPSPFLLLQESKQETGETKKNRVHTLPE